LEKEQSKQQLNQEVNPMLHERGVYVYMYIFKSKNA
jgi:hypothetical protein